MTTHPMTCRSNLTVAKQTEQSNHQNHLACISEQKLSLSMVRVFPTEYGFMDKDTL